MKRPLLPPWTKTPMVRKATGLPSGVIPANSKTNPFQARIFYKRTPDEKVKPRSIGSFPTRDAAVAELAAKQALFDAAGPDAVRPPEQPKAERAKRMAVRRSPLRTLSPQSLCHHLTCFACVPDRLVRL